MRADVEVAISKDATFTTVLREVLPPEFAVIASVGSYGGLRLSAGIEPWVLVVTTTDV